MTNEEYSERDAIKAMKDATWILEMARKVVKLDPSSPSP